MSLNGLENPAIIEAYQFALAEAGGWFLLKYVARDEVALLARGSGGVPEVRNTIISYEEVSPLMGFLQYRRRKVILRYTPQGLSRLILARTTVHFQSILDKFSPHDTVFTFNGPGELTESALSSACLLHAASGSITSSSSSLRRRRLMEITEDAEEAPSGKEAAAPSSPEAGEGRSRSYSHLSEATVVPGPAGPTLERSVTLDESRFAATIPLNDPAPHDQPPAVPSLPDLDQSMPGRSFIDDLGPKTSDPRKSTQSTRPSLRDLEHASAYPTKVKRGPRPSMDTNGRPRTAGSLSRSQDQRLVASLPASVRSSSSRKGNASANVNPTAIATQPQPTLQSWMSGKRIPPIPPLLVPPPTVHVPRPKLSPGAKSMSALSSSGMSPEKERLMKALQQRKKQMQKRAEEARRKKLQAEERQVEAHTEENKENQFPDTAGTVDGHQVLPSSLQTEPVSEVETVANGRSGHVNDPQADSGPQQADNREPAMSTEAHEIEEDPPSEDSVPSVPSTVSADYGESTDVEPSQTPQTVYEDEQEQNPMESAKDQTVTISAPVEATGEIPLVMQADCNFDDPGPSLEPSEQPAPAHADEDGNTHTQPVDIDHPLAESVVSVSRPASVAEALPHNGAEDTNSTICATPDAPGSIVEETPRAKERRKPQLEPIRVPHPDESDCENLLSDDSFMEELQRARVEEAKPVSVGKSPRSPPSPPSAWNGMRSVSNPGAAGHPASRMQASSVGRPASSPYAYADADIPPVPVLVAKKVNVSSGISKRIKALEQLANSRELPTTPGHNLTANAGSSSFESLLRRASSSLGPAGLESVPQGSASRGSSLSRQNSTTASRRTNSVSVSARITRDLGILPDDHPSEPPTQSEPVEPKPLTAPVTPHIAGDVTPTISEGRSMSVSSTGSTQNSSATATRPGSRLSVSSRSKAVEGGHHSASASESGGAGTAEEKKTSRTSRLLRRMSSITSSSRKTVMNALSPVLREEGPATPSTAPTPSSTPAPAPAPKVPEPDSAASEAPQAIDIGEVNVQFPDTLLWKRRFVRIDEKGFLVFTPANVNVFDSISRNNMVKRYHLTEFKRPCLPDEDMQELPNSILLDFLEGSTLQCACESRSGQAFVLETLVDAHRRYQ